ncbi:MAG: hypothetical protein ACK5MO_06955, partial [Planctomyces sp.]
MSGIGQSMGSYAASWRTIQANTQSDRRISPKPADSAQARCPPGCQSFQGRTNVQAVEMHIQNAETVLIRERGTQGLVQVAFRVNLKSPAGTQQ